MKTKEFIDSIKQAAFKDELNKIAQDDKKQPFWKSPMATALGIGSATALGAHFATGPAVKFIAKRFPQFAKKQKAIQTGLNIGAGVLGDVAIGGAIEHHEKKRRQ